MRTDRGHSASVREPATILDILLVQYEEEDRVFFY